MRFLLRPIYRAFFKRPLRWGFGKLRAFFLADVIARLQSVEQLSAQLHEAEKNLAGQLHNLRAELVPYLQRAEVELGTLEPRFAAQHAHNAAHQAYNAAQWDAIEQLILAMFRLPESQTSTSGLDSGAPEESQYPRTVALNEVHAIAHLR